MSGQPRVMGRVLCLCILVVFSRSSILVSQETGTVTERASNEAARVTVTGSGFEARVAAAAAPAGKAFFILDTEWKNIHPKKEIEKSKLEKKQDRTMGVGGLLGGGKNKQKEEMVEADVAYLVPSLLDHVYLLADGQAHSLDKLTEAVPDGVDLGKGLSLPKQGDTKKVRFVFLIPENSKNIAFQFFDYSFGHILILLRGDLKLAAAGAAGSKVLGTFRDEYFELAATALEFRAEYEKKPAPEGWRYAVIQLSGKSLSGSAAKKNIVQVKPQEYVWLATGAGHLYYSCGGSTTDDGFIRFTPEFFQSQEVAFVVPASEKAFSLGLRVQNRVYAIGLGAAPAAPPAVEASALHRDGDTLEIMLFGARREKGTIILDLGVRSLVKSGIEVQAGEQFIVKAGGDDIRYDKNDTGALLHRPPTPFTIPSQTFVRFELAYETPARPDSLYYRGFKSERTFDLSRLIKK